MPRLRRQRSSLLLSATVLAIPAAPSHDGQPRFDVPVAAIAMDTADSFATVSCAWTAKACWPTFSPPPYTATEGAPSLACAVVERGRVVCWAMVHKSLFGSRLQLTALPGIEGAVEVAVGQSQVCARRETGELDCLYYAWNASARDWVMTEATRRPGLWKSVSAGRSQLCAVSMDGAVRCWSRYVTCRNLNESTRPAPVVLACEPEVPDTMSDAGGAARVATGWIGICAVLEDGKLACWGEHALADAGSSTRPSIVPQLGGVVAAAVSDTHACALRRDGNIFCWPAVRGMSAFGATTREVRKVPATRPARQVALEDGVTYWLDDQSRAYVLRQSAEPELLAEGVAEIAAGGQLCVRWRAGGVSCWARPLRTTPRAGDAIVTTSATVFVGGGASRIDRDPKAAFDLGARLEVALGPADREAQQRWAIGPIIEVRSRDLASRELAGGVSWYYAPNRAGNPALSLAVLGGYADRRRLDEPLLALLGRLTLRDSHQGRWIERRYAQVVSQLNLYAAARYGLRSEHVEVTSGLEFDLLFPMRLAD